MANKRISDLPAVTSSTVGDVVAIDGTTTRKITVEDLLADNLVAIKDLTSAADKGIQFTGSGTAATFDLTAAGKALLDDADATAQRTTLGLVIGTDVQAYDAELAALAGLTSAADSLPYFTGSGSASLATFTTFGRSLVDDANASAARTTLGLVIGTDVQAHSAALDSVSGTNTGDQTITLTGDVTGSGTGSFAATITKSITPTWTGTHTFNNGTYSALFTNPAGFGGQTTPAAPIHVGTGSMASGLSNIVSARANTGSSNVHGISENSTYNLSASGLGVADFDALATYTGTQTYDHHISFQSRPVYGSSGTITNLYGFGDFSQVNAGTATNHYQFYASGPIGAGTITNAYGFYAESIIKGTTLNYAFYSAGTTPSKFGGNLDVGSLSVAGTDATSAWTAYTPTITAASGTITTVTGATGRYKQIGKTVFFAVNFTITTNGTGSGAVQCTYPVTAKSGVSFFTLSGMRSGSITVTGLLNTTSKFDILDYNGVYPGADGRAFYMTGTYEAN